MKPGLALAAAIRALSLDDDAHSSSAVIVLNTLANLAQAMDMDPLDRQEVLSSLRTKLSEIERKLSGTQSRTATVRDAITALSQTHLRRAG